jgi:hypothetical protein
VIYHLCGQEDGRIVLDREVRGVLLKQIAVKDPSVIRREIDGEMVDVPQYWESFSEARAKVEDSAYRHVWGAGWFFAKDDGETR